MCLLRCHRRLPAAALLLSLASPFPAQAALIELTGPNVFGQVESLYGWNGALYAGVRPSLESPTPQLLRSDDGQVLGDISDVGMGVGNPRSLTSFSGSGSDRLYLIGGASGTGGGIWSSADGSTFTTIVNDGFGDANNVDIPAVAEYGGELFIGTRNDSGSGGEIWRSADGVTWTQSGVDGHARRLR